MDHLMEVKSTSGEPADAGGAVATAPAPPAPDGGTADDRSVETTAAGIPWLVFARHRRAIAERWPLLWDLRVTTSHFDVLGSLPAGTTPADVLDVGATDRRHARTLGQRFPGIEYRSLDVDRTLPHDYHDFAEVDRTFDLVSCTEVLEHVAEDVGIGILRDCVRACRPGGHVLVSVPNCIVPYYQMEFTHRTAYTYRDLAAACRTVGLDVVDMTRVALGSARTRWVHRTFLARWHRLMGTDWCASITCLARRPATDDAAA